MNVFHKCIAVLKEYRIIDMMTGLDNRQMCQLMAAEVVEVVSTVTIHNEGCMCTVCTRWSIASGGESRCLCPVLRVRSP